MGTPSIRCSNKKVKVVEIDQFKNTQEDLAVGRGKGKINNAHREDSNKIECPAMKQVTVSVCSRLRSVSEGFCVTSNRIGESRKKMQKKRLINNTVGNSLLSGFRKMTA